MNNATLPMVAWDVWQGGEVVDTVFYDADMDADEVWRSLVYHDGYASSIRVTC